MIAHPHKCNRQQLSQLLDETLDQRQQATVESHLDHCQYCRAELEELTADARWWSDTRTVLSQLEFEFDAGPIEPLEQPAATSGSLPHTHPATDTDSADSHAHWVMQLLQATSDNDALGELDGMPVFSVIGQGGMGVVVKARDRHLHRFLAIKLLSPMLASSGASRERFFREARAAAAVVHPNIVPIYAVSSDRQLPYLVMPYVAGGNLQQMIDREGPLPLERALSIGLQVAEGLSAAHRQGIIHRDIKPANLMLDEGGFRVLLTDFGLARALDDASLTGSGFLAGTPQYMSPEQSRGGAIDPRSDIYSLGAVLYSMATGRPPVRGHATLEILRRIGEESPKPIVEVNESYPEWYDCLVSRLMAANAADRPQSSEAVVSLLRGCLAHVRGPRQIALPSELRHRRHAGWLSRAVTRWWLGGLSASILLAAGLLLASSTIWKQAPRTVGEQTTSTETPLPPANVPLPTTSAGDSWEAYDAERMLDDCERALLRLQQELDE